MDFVDFKKKRLEYERWVQEKASEMGIKKLPLTSYRNSMDSQLISLFITSGWLTETRNEDVTEESLKSVVEKQAEV